MTIEYRDAGGTATASEGVLNGLVTPFNVWTTIGDIQTGGFKERVAPGAFAKTLQERDVVLINSHKTDQPMARTSITEGPGSLALTEDSSAGLRARALPVDTSYARDVMACADAGVTRGMSFGFEVIKQDWTDAEGRSMNPNTATHRTIQEVRLHEVTTTAFPAYATTTLSARDLVTAAREGRAAKASYSDLNTCGECGATGQYDSFCSGCGKPMSDPPTGDAFCSACGTELGDERSAHVCPETRAAQNCPSCGQALTSPSNPGPDGDSDSDADDQMIDRASVVATLRKALDNPNVPLTGALLLAYAEAEDALITSEPAETTRDEDGPLYAASLRAFHGF